MPEDALEDEPEWTVDKEPDLGEGVTILKEIDTLSKNKEKEKITEKTVPRKKLSTKQQQLQNAAKNSKKSTEFFSKKRLTPPTSSLLLSPCEETAAHCFGISSNNGLLGYKLEAVHDVAKLDLSLCILPIYPQI